MALGFWLQQCPARGAALSHAHSMYCKPDVPHNMKGEPGRGEELHREDECCHCRMTPEEFTQDMADAIALETDLEVPQADEEDLPEPFSVVDRLEALGLMPVATNPEPEPVRGHDFDGPEEPAMAQGEYPGPSWGPGRGIMGFRVRQNLELIAYIERTRGYR